MVEEDGFGVQGVPEWRALVALHSGEVIRCRHLSGDPVAREVLILNRLHQHRLPGLGVHLNPATGGIKHGDAIVIIDPDGARM